MPDTDEEITLMLVITGMLFILVPAIWWALSC